MRNKALSTDFFSQVKSIRIEIKARCLKINRSPVKHFVFTSCITYRNRWSAGIHRYRIVRFGGRFFQMS
jgi:hypothetical protein